MEDIVHHPAVIADPVCERLAARAHGLALTENTRLVAGALDLLGKRLAHLEGKGQLLGEMPELPVPPENKP